MSIEDHIQPVVTVAAFDPLADEVVVLERAKNAKHFPGLFELVGGKVEIIDEDLIKRLVLEIQQEIKVILDPKHLALTELIGIHRPGRKHLLSYRYTGALPTSSAIEIPSEEAIDHPNYRLVNATNFDALSYVPGMREFLAALFREFQESGTLLSTLRQPVYVRPVFLHFEGEQLVVPMEDVRGGMPRTYRREEYLHIDEVLGDIVHHYLDPRRKRAHVLRMSASPKTLNWKGQEKPVWQMDYGIKITSAEAAALLENHKVVVLPASPCRPLGLAASYSDTAKNELVAIRTLASKHLLLATTMPRIEFDEAQKTGPVIR